MRAELLGVSGPTAIEVHPAAGAGTLAIAGFAALLLVLVLRSSRLTKITPAAGTMELRDETPAIVDLLTGGFDVEDDAVPATVVDLAARGWYTIEDYGEDTIIRTKRVPPTDDRLQPYEQRVLDYIDAHTIDGVVPTRVLTTGRKQISKRWFRGFTNEVVHHAQQLGLCSRRWGWGQIAAAWVLAGLAGVPAFLVFDAAEAADDVSDWASLGNLLAGLAIVVAVLLAYVAVRVSRYSAQRDTGAGTAAAAHWLGVRDFYRTSGQFADKSAASVAIWDRHLAYATAMGLAHEVQRQIPFESEHDRHAWSRATGQWRRVKVRYRTIRPGWGMHPVLVVFQSFFTIALLGALAWASWNVADGTWKQHYESYVAVTPEQERWINLVAMALVVIPAAFMTHALVRFLLGGADLFRRRTIEGELVRARAFGGSDDTEPRYHLAIDTATQPTREGDTILAFKVRSSIYRQVAQGARVRARVSPALGYVASIETIAPAPVHVQRLHQQAGRAEQAVGAVADQAGAAVTGVVSGFLASYMARQAAKLTDAQLDAVGPDGKTVREMLAESQAQIDAAFGTTPPDAPVPPEAGGAVSIG